MLYRFIIVITLAALAASCQAYDEPRLSHEAEVLRNYFDIEGIVFDTSNTTLIKRYSDSVIREMELTCLLKGSGKDFPQVVRYNGDINKIIYQEQLASRPETWMNGVFIDSALDALDLIVPDSVTDPIFHTAKKELRDFVSISKDKAEALLKRIYEPMKDGDLHTFEAIKFLQNAYYHWIPLADLEQRFSEIPPSS